MKYSARLLLSLLTSLWTMDGAVATATTAETNNSNHPIRALQFVDGDPPATAKPSEPTGGSTDLTLVQTNLDAARTLFDAMISPDDSEYKFGYTLDSYAIELSREPYVATVVNSTIVTSLVNAATGMALNETQLEMVGGGYTVHDLFDRIQSAIDQEAFELGVEYDVTYGYPTLIQIDYELQMIDEEFNLSVQSFLPLDDLATQLEQGLQQWTAGNALQSYQFSFQQLCECPNEQAQPFRVIVVNETLYSSRGVLMAEATNDLIAPIPQLLTNLMSLLETEAVGMRLDLHPTLGYPMFALVDTNALVADDEIIYTITNLRALTDEELAALTASTLTPGGEPENGQDGDDASAAPTMAPVTAVTESLAPSASPLTVSSSPSVTPSVATTSMGPSHSPTTLAPVSAAPTVLGATPDPTSLPSTTPTLAPTTPVPTNTPTMTPAPSVKIFDGESAACALNEACVGLVEDCCPTMEGVYLYCCLEEPPTSGYSQETTLLGPANTDEATYFASTSIYVNPSQAPDGTTPVVEYTRNGTQIFDLIYLETGVIVNATDFVMGVRKFYMDVYTTAPSCTQLLVQLDALPLATADNFPTGRHSRYVAFTTTTNQWERLEFTYLDSPHDDSGDGDALDTDVNPITAIAILLAPGTLTEDTYYLANFNVGVEGCNPLTQECETTDPKSCPALLEGETCTDGIDNDNDGLVDCADSDCLLDPVCTETITRSFASAVNQLDSSFRLANTKNSGSVRLTNGWMVVGGTTISAIMTLLL